MTFSVSANGEIRISELTGEERKRLNLLLGMADRKGGVFDDNGYVLYALVNAEEESQKGNYFGELRWLRETSLRLKGRIAKIVRARAEHRPEDVKSGAPELIPCPQCGAPAVLKYHGYLLNYYCSNEKCGANGGMAETQEGAAYNWNTQKERSDFHEAVRSVEWAKFSPPELERLAFMLLKEIMKKEGVIGERD